MFSSLRKFTIKSTRGAVCSLACASSLLSCAPFALAQSPEVLRTPTPAAATAQTAVPALIPYSGVLETTGVKTTAGPANMTFLIYKDEQGGEPLWAESQTIEVDSQQRYSAKLGASLSKGIPEDLFSSGEARWLEVQVAGRPPQARVLLLSVPYALKAADATTLGGLPASAYALAGTNQSGVFTSPDITPKTVATVTTTGGTANSLAKFSGASTIVKSIITDNGTQVGIGTSTPNATLGVKGTFTVNGVSTYNGQLLLPAVGTATSSASYDSQVVRLYTSAYNSSSKAVVTPQFEWQAGPTGNNTSAPSAILNLLSSATSTSPTKTGFYFNIDGTMHFATGQTFPGAPGTGTITGITTTSPLAGSGTSGSVALSLNTSALETTLNGKYPQLTAANKFTSSGTWAGPITGNSGGTMYAIQGNTSAGLGVEGTSTGTAGTGVEGYSTGNGGVGIYGNATGNANGSTYPIGVLAHVVSGTGVKSSLDSGQSGQTAVLGQTNGASSQYATFLGEGLVAGVWGDVANSSVAVPMAIAGTADDGYGGVFENTSDNWSTIYVYNRGSHGTGNVARADASGRAATAGHFDTLMAGNQNGTCGIGGNGDLSCTGQIKSLISTRAGERTVETYSVQSPENWMEDFGAAELRNGSATVTIDPAFAETTSGSVDYHVFLTPNGDSKGLYVVSKTANTFEVRESGGGSASISFDYRIVAKRRGFEAQRLTDVTETFKKEMAATPTMMKGLKTIRQTRP